MTAIGFFLVSLSMRPIHTDEWKKNETVKSANTFKRGQKKCVKHKRWKQKSRANERMSNLCFFYEHIVGENIHANSDNNNNNNQTRCCKDEEEDGTRIRREKKPK